MRMKRKISGPREPKLPRYPAVYALLPHAAPNTRRCLTQQVSILHLKFIFMVNKESRDFSELLSLWFIMASAV